MASSVERALLAVSLVSVAHSIALGVPRIGDDRTILFFLGDVADGGLSVSVAYAHMLLALRLSNAAPSDRPAVALHVHGLLCGLLVLAQGMHMVKNPLDTIFSHAEPSASLASIYRTAYWQHEYLSHRLSMFATMALWLSASMQSGHAAANPSAWWCWSLRVAALVHAAAFGMLVIGTRTIPVVLPLAILLLARSCARDCGAALREFTFVFSLGLLTLHAGWLTKHGGNFPTFDDLHAEPHDVLAASARKHHAAFSPVSRVLWLWAAPASVVIVTAASAVAVLCCAGGGRSLGAPFASEVAASGKSD